MAIPKNRGLGKGLEALFNEVEFAVRDDPSTSIDIGDSVMPIDIHTIKPNKDQPRKQFDDEKIEELAKSIEIHGVLQPIMVRKAGMGYEIVAGERRWRAARKAGLKQIPCIVREVTDEQNMLIALIENMQREDLNAIEEAQGLERMINHFELTQEEVSKSVGKSRSYVTNALRLLKLPSAVQEMVTDGRLTGGHARAIAGIKTSDKQLKAAEKCCDEGWSVREIENFAREDHPTGNPKNLIIKKRDREISAVEEELQAILGTKVNIIHGTKKGKIEIEYYSREELDRLLDMLHLVKG
jgi:ParB family chromosome partitioning protein